MKMGISDRFLGYWADSTADIASRFSPPVAVTFHDQLIKTRSFVVQLKGWRAYALGLPLLLRPRTLILAPAGDRKVPQPILAPVARA